MVIVLLSGVSGSGKTSTCMSVAETAHKANTPTGGILCRAVFQDGRKAGIECADLAANPAQQPWMLAHIRQDWARPRSLATVLLPESPRNPAFDDSDSDVLRYGMWEFSKQALVSADQAIIGYASKASETKNDETSPGGNAELHPPILFVDEIGPLELDRGTGLVKTLAMLDDIARQDETGLRFLVVARPDIAARLKERWPVSTMVEMDGTSYRKTAEAIVIALNQTAGRKC